MDDISSITFYDFPKLPLALWDRVGVRELPW
jgi:hypothetical protein